MMNSPNSPRCWPELSDALKAGDRALRRAMTQSQLLYKGEALIRTGEVSETVYRLQSGWAACRRLLSGERWQIISIFLPGALLGITSTLQAPQPDTLECLTDASVQTIGWRACASSWRRSRTSACV